MYFFVLLVSDLLLCGGRNSEEVAKWGCNIYAIIYNRFRSPTCLITTYVFPTVLNSRNIIVLKYVKCYTQIYDVIRIIDETRKGWHILGAFEPANIWLLCRTWQPFVYYCICQCICSRIHVCPCEYIYSRYLVWTGLAITTAELLLNAVTACSDYITVTEVCYDTCYMQ